MVKGLIVQINSSNYGSTGNIMLQIADKAREYGYEAVTCCPISSSNLKKKIKDQILIGNRVGRNLHILLAKISGFNGCFSIIDTYLFINKLKKKKPDIIHFHNLHNCYINLPILFRYIKKNNISVVWTLHDCWAFTGHCPYFTMAKCEKWKEGCYDCPSYKEYPQSMVDQTRTMWKLKKKWFTGVDSMTIITPSAWLADLARQSFLKECQVKVINNGIDLSVFKPTISDFREKHGILANKTMLLGVAFGWGKRKGLDIFIELAKRLDSEKYQIVLVGTDTTVDKLLPPNVISVHRTRNQKELAEIYSSAEILINPTREENYPTVNMESIACGTPVVTFQTGGSPEILTKETGRIVKYDDIEELIRTIEEIRIENVDWSQACLDRAANFNRATRFEEYVNLYDIIMRKSKKNESVFQ